ncbi:MAG: hypothetical protein KDB36_08345, partial [Acidimicrobiales bacterium]|nr:hypothetical protein [Acidimicrobiales bacterium]
MGRWRRESAQLPLLGRRAPQPRRHPRLARRGPHRRRGGSAPGAARRRRPGTRRGAVRHLLRRASGGGVVSAPAPTPTAPARLAIAGSTGSIGRQALDVVAAADGAYVVTGLGAGGGDLDTLIAQARAVRPVVVAVARDDRATVARLEDALPFCEVRAGDGALASLAPDADVVLNAVVGFAGLPVTMAALDAGRRLALANKESLVAGGPVVQAARATPGAELVPVDSEHGAIHMCLRGVAADRVARLVLTASGGPFRGRSADELSHVTVADALDHPTWTMGPKITVDSSTLMNKGLEVIEAYELFGTPAGAAGVGV